MVVCFCDELAAGTLGSCPLWRCCINSIFHCQSEPGINEMPFLTLAILVLR